ncbi:mechanosensitive ion channel family protein [Paraburkholderia youngii]|uniref:mechanosensitive ion channel family protein n=1 Tax=Paraburkholderia youngii TaxID=2782701 RepID=UPI001590F7DB|nr:mechanosensitive ion channel family protein [Paraburkholderia youngii]NUX52677.1 mechanosensitive ion channel [Paraburkholderia youngii]
MNEPLNQILYPCGAAGINVLVLLWSPGRRHPILHAALKCALFVLLTVSMLRYGIVPTQAAHRFSDPSVHFLHGVLETGWWLLAAATTMAVVRAYYVVGYRLRQNRFTLDVIAALLYLGAVIAIVADVFDIPLKGVLATSGALAIVLGLALQSTLSDLFSGLLINATSPYRVGDSVTLDEIADGEVVEVTWRATHIAKANRDMVVVPNSVIAKSRIVNRSFPLGPHATVARFETTTQLRPSEVVHALELAVQTCVGISQDPKPSVATTSIGRRTAMYDVTFFRTGERSEVEVLNKFYDAAHRHLESITVPLEHGNEVADIPGGTLAYRLVEAIGIFGMLSKDQRIQLAKSLVRRECAPGQVLLAAGTCSQSISIVGYGVVAASATEDSGGHYDIVRLGPREYFGESGPIAGVASMVTFVARTYVIVYELPDHAVMNLLKQHADVAHAFAAKLEARERKGQALMQVSPEVHMAENGLMQWLHRCIEAIHHKLA